MDDLARLLTLLALCGGAFTLLGAIIVWRLDEVRRIRRSFARVLSADPQPLLTARGRGAGIGFNLASNQLAVTSDRGDWCLIYGISELMGVELIVDRQVAARVYRGERRLPLAHLAVPEDWIRLRFVFDDPSHPDFSVDLWRPEDENHHGRHEVDSALQDANRWIARMEAILRRGAIGTPSDRGPLVMAPPPVRQTPPPSPTSAYEMDEDDLPWTDSEFEDDQLDDDERMRLRRKS